VNQPALRVATAFIAFVTLPLLRAADTFAPHNFARWEKEIAAYEAADRTNPPPQGGILFTGASTIRRWSSLAQDFPQHKVLNRGVGGSEIEDITHFADRIVFPYAPRAIFFRSGGNDIFKGKTPERAFADFKSFVALVHAKLPKTQIVFISQNPTVARVAQWPREKALNDLVADFAQRTPNVRYLDVVDVMLGPDGQPRLELYVPDKLHFNETGYKLFAERIRPNLPK
jgi:lysophospholipase L1-like esterase